MLLHLTLVFWSFSDYSYCLCVFGPLKKGMLETSDFKVPTKLHDLTSSLEPGITYGLSVGRYWCCIFAGTELFSFLLLSQLEKGRRQFFEAKVFWLVICAGPMPPTTPRFVRKKSVQAENLELLN